MDSSQKYVYMHHCLPELARWVGIRSSAALPQLGRRPPGGPAAAPPCPARARSAPIHSRAGYTPALQSAWASHPPTSSARILCPSNHSLLMRKNSFTRSDQNGECHCDLRSCQMWTGEGEMSQAEYLSGFGRFLFSTFCSMRKSLPDALRGGDLAASCLRHPEHFHRPGKSLDQRTRFSRPV